MALSKRNKRGLFYLLFILLLISLTPRVYRSLREDSTNISFEEAKKIDKEFKAIKKKEKSIKKRSRYNVPQKSFNPNEYSKRDWMNLGLSSKQADVVIKFTVYGLKSNDDLKSIFVIDDELFGMIKDSTFYPEKLETNSTEFITEVKQNSNSKFVLDLNTSSSEEFQRLKGIGPFFGDKMVEYREKLGGYIQIEQLLEIWKFDSEKLNVIKDQLTIGNNNIRKININTADYLTLVKHPYIDSKVANSIIKMKEQQGVYSNIEEIKRSKLIDHLLFEKIKNYIKV